MAKEAKSKAKPAAKAKPKRAKAETLGVTANAAPNYHGQLTASVVDSVTMDRPWSTISVVVSDSSSTRVDYTIDGSTPVVGGSPTGRVIPAGPATDLLTFRGGPQAPTIKLISTATLHYSIVGET